MNGHAIIPETPMHKHALTILALLLANTTETRDSCIHIQYLFSFKTFHWTTHSV